MDKDEETISRDQFFNDIMQGFEEASAFARGQKNLRVTHVRIENSASADTVVNIHAAGKEDAPDNIPPSAPESR